MRRLTIRLLAVCLLGAGLSQLHAGSASACISFDHRAEMRVVNRAIASRTTPATTKAKLKALRAEMSSRPGDTATGQALKLIGKDRIVKRAASTGRMPKGVQASGCG